MKITSFGLSDVGQRREQNEDSILVDDGLGLYLVADGMGGHLGGEFASRLAVETVQEVFRQISEDPEATLLEEQEDVATNIGERLKYAVRVASLRVFEEATKNENLTGMGTTAVGLAINEECAYIINVGDSRTYLIRDNEIQQLTEDHSLVREQIRAGFIDEERARTHRLKNIITRSVGYQRDVDADLFIRDLEEGDLFLLCSDGLSNMVSDKDILKIVNKNKTLEKFGEKLIAEANHNGGDDNVSVVLVGVGEIE